VRTVRYLALVVAATFVAIATVREHVARTRLGYEARALERDVDRLKELRRAALLDREHAAAPEKLVLRAREFQIASDGELKALVAPVAPPRKGH
jgi:hypothetical protein